MINLETLYRPSEALALEAVSETQAQDIIESNINVIIKLIRPDVRLLKYWTKRIRLFHIIGGEQFAFLYGSEDGKQSIAKIESDKVQGIAFDVMGKYGFDRLNFDGASHLSTDTDPFPTDNNGFMTYENTLLFRSTSYSGLGFLRTIQVTSEDKPISVGWEAVDTDPFVLKIGKAIPRKPPKFL